MPTTIITKLAKGTIEGKIIWSVVSEDDYMVKYENITNLTNSKTIETKLMYNKKNPEFSVLFIWMRKETKNGQSNIVNVKPLAKIPEHNKKLNLLYRLIKKKVKS